MSDVELRAGEGGLGQVVVDGADVTDFVRGLGIDVEKGKGTRVVLEGGASLEVFLESVDADVRRLPPLSAEEVGLLREAAEAWDPDDEFDRDRARRAVESLEDLLR